MAESIPKRPPSALSEIFLAACVAFGFAFMLNDIVVIEFSTLRFLGIRYPAILPYSPLLGPALGFFAWLLLRRKSAPLAAVLFIALPCLMTWLTVAWIDQQTESVPVARWIDDLKPLEVRLGFKVTEEGDSHGTRLIVARGHLQQLSAEVHRVTKSATTRSTEAGT